MSVQACGLVTTLRLNISPLAPVTRMVVIDVEPMTVLGALLQM